MWRMPDILPVCMQDVLHGRKSELRKSEKISGRRTDFISSDLHRCLLYVMKHRKDKIA